MAVLGVKSVYFHTMRTNQRPYGLGVKEISLRCVFVLAQGSQATDKKTEGNQQDERN
jgi:hypothetical protein